jgi:hypothetical protein
MSGVWPADPTDRKPNTMYELPLRKTDQMGESSVIHPIWNRIVRVVAPHSRRLKLDELNNTCSLIQERG